MAADVALSQALAYARDLKNLYEVARAREEETVRAHDKLRAAYQQSLAYAVDLKKTHRRLQRSILQSLLGLANALEAKDEYTRGHSDRVAALGRRLALEAGLAVREADVIAQSGLLHDLGKIGVPEPILRKPGPLTEEEWAVMRRHPVTGSQIVAPLEFFAEGALIVRHHHEREDGSGYPDGLSGESDTARRARCRRGRRLRRAHFRAAVPARPDARRGPRSARDRGGAHARRAAHEALHRHGRPCAS